MPARLTRIVRFRARHHYRVAGWSEAQNRARFGPLVEPHEHEYECAVTLRGQIDPQGMIVDLALLDRILADEVRTPFDNADLNRAVPQFAAGEEQPTCEALARVVFGRVAARLPAGVTLARVRIAEDPSLAGEYAGPE
jgi:6-pyruvoyltetrahydropterin/6-carboxytetrahydropterin synthase